MLASAMTIRQPYHCPACYSHEIRPMPVRSYESESGVNWYECGTCKHMWHQEKVAPLNPGWPIRRREPLRH